MHSIFLHGVKHGVGTTVSSILLAARLGGEVLGRDAQAPDMSVAMGKPRSGIIARHRFGPADVEVVDHGVPSCYWNTPRPTTHNMLVCDTSYLAIARIPDAMEWFEKGALEGIVVVQIPESALTVRDIEAVADLPAKVVIAKSPTVARVVDAGLLTARQPECIRVFTLAQDLGITNKEGEARAS